MINLDALPREIRRYRCLRGGGLLFGGGAALTLSFMAFDWCMSNLDKLGIAGLGLVFGSQGLVISGLALLVSGIATVLPRKGGRTPERTLRRYLKTTLSKDWLWPVHGGLACVHPQAQDGFASIREFTDYRAHLRESFDRNLSSLLKRQAPKWWMTIQSVEISPQAPDGTMTGILTTTIHTLQEGQPRPVFHVRLKNRIKKAGDCFLLSHARWETDSPPKSTEGNEPPRIAA